MQRRRRSGKDCGSVHINPARRKHFRRNKNDRRVRSGRAGHSLICPARVSFPQQGGRCRWWSPPARPALGGGDIHVAGDRGTSNRLPDSRVPSTSPLTERISRLSASASSSRIAPLAVLRLASPLHLRAGEKDVPAGGCHGQGISPGILQKDFPAGGFNPERAHPPPAGTGRYPRWRYGRIGSPFGYPPTGFFRWHFAWTDSLRLARSKRYLHWRWRRPPPPGSDRQGRSTSPLAVETVRKSYSSHAGTRWCSPGRSRRRGVGTTGGCPPP